MPGTGKCHLHACQVPEHLIFLLLFSEQLLHVAGPMLHHCWSCYAPIRSWCLSDSRKHDWTLDGHSQCANKGSHMVQAAGCSA